MAVPGGHGHHVGPAVHVALAEGAVAHRPDGAVGPDAHGVVFPGGHGDHVGPVGGLALAELVIAHRQDGAVVPQGYGVEPPGGDGPFPGGLVHLPGQGELDTAKVTEPGLVPEHLAAAWAEALHLGSAHIAEPGALPELDAAGFASGHGDPSLGLSFVEGIIADLGGENNPRTAGPSGGWLINRVID